MGAPPRTASQQHHPLGCTTGGVRERAAKAEEEEGPDPQWEHSAQGEPGRPAQPPSQYPRFGRPPGVATYHGPPSLEILPAASPL